MTCLVDNSCLPPVDYDNFSFDGERYRVLYRARAFTFATPGEALEYIHDINSEAVGAAPIYIVLASDGETRLMERADETVITRDIEQTLTILRWVGKVKSVS